VRRIYYKILVENDIIMKAQQHNILKPTLLNQQIREISKDMNIKLLEGN